MIDLKSGMTVFMRKNFKIILYLHSDQQRQPSAEVQPNIRYSFGDDGQIFNFGQIVKSDLQPIST